MERAASTGARVQLSIWLGFLASIVAALPSLTSLLAYVVSVTSAGENVPQQPVFWLPCFIAVFAGATLLSIRTFTSRDSPLGRHLGWLSLTCYLVLAGILRESTIIPSSGNPLVDLLIAFVPFVLAALSIGVSSRKLLRGTSRASLGQSSQELLPI